MQVFYLDNMNFGNLIPPKILLPHVLDYPSRILKILEKEDKYQLSATGLAEYGMHEVSKIVKWKITELHQYYYF